MNNAVTASTLAVSGAKVYYEARGTGPLVVLVGAPMDARSFAPLADLLATGYTVVTTDPRGINRSPVDDREQDSTPELRADDLARIIEHVDAGPAAVFGSSGGAVSVLALTQSRPDLVHTVIAHEPPLNELLDDRDWLREKTDEMIAVYFSGDQVGAMRIFLEIANIQMPEEMFLAIFGGERDAQQISDDDFQFGRMLIPTVRFIPDVETLRVGKPRIVIGIGEESAGQLCDRASRVLSGQLGIEPTMFPGDHIGFAEDAVAFERRLRAVLAG